ncbi:hypothetical protein EhVM1_000302 [Emiliania huxleyi virus M1]|nr:hypothetical protein EhVM1_000302 [Emiliania huxleyi virus M1]
MAFGKMAISKTWKGKGSRAIKENDSNCINFILLQLLSFFLKEIGISVEGASVKFENKDAKLGQVAAGSGLKYVQVTAVAIAKGEHMFQYDSKKRDFVKAITKAVRERMEPFMGPTDRLVIQIPGITTPAIEGSARLYAKNAGAPLELAPVVFGKGIRLASDPTSKKLPLPF